MIDAIQACFGVAPNAPAHELIDVAPDASREEIVFALLACAGVEGDAYWSDVLLRLPDPVDE
jgi:hypothetical protein